MGPFSMVVAIVFILMIGRVLWDEFFSNNDWAMASAVAVTMVALILVPLAIFNRLAGNKWEYRLAQSFELADDLKSITFTLRDGLKWSDGEPLTADDVVFTYDYLKKFPALDFLSVLPLMD